MEIETLNHARNGTCETFVGETKKKKKKKKKKKEKRGREKRKKKKRERDFSGNVELDVTDVKRI